MSTEAQIAANQLNALKSTGPTSDEGKEACSLNATTHGCTSKKKLEKMRRTTEYDERAKRLKAEIGPTTERQEGFIETAMLNLIQSKFCLQSLDLECDKLSDSATDNWETTQAAAAQHTLAKIKKAPRVIAAELTLTLAGCRALIAEWMILRAALARLGAWKDDLFHTAFDLLGIPRHLREGSPAVRPNDCDNLVLHQEHLADAQIARLQAIIDRGIGRADDIEREYVISGVDCIATPRAERILRYMHIASGRYERYLAYAFGAQEPPVSRGKSKTQPVKLQPVPMPISTRPPISPPPPPPAPQGPTLPESGDATTPESGTTISPFPTIRQAVTDVVAHLATLDISDDEKMDMFDQYFHNDVKPVLERYAQSIGMSRKELDDEFNALDLIFSKQMDS